MKLVLGFVLSALSMSVFANAHNCKEHFNRHFNRVNMIKELYYTGSMSREDYQVRMSNEAKIMPIMEVVMCKGLSKKDKQGIKLEAMSEISVY